MKYKCCNYLLHQIVFDQTEIKPCCATSMNNESAVFISNFSGRDFDIKHYIEQRSKYIEMFKNGNIPECCKNCPIIEENEWDENDLYFDRIIVSNIAKCSCNCIYCVYTYNNPEMKEYYNTRKPYDIKPILLSLRNKNLLKDNFLLIIGGGECTEYPAGLLDWLLYFTSANNGRIQILSSGIKYSKSIEQFLKYGNCELIISPDSGTKKTYEKIKRVKAFNNVWNNLKKYIFASSLNEKAYIEIKYIIIPDVNDNILEVKNFLDKCKTINCKNIHLDIEHYWYSKNKEKSVPEKINQIHQYIKQNKGNLNLNYSAETYLWLNQNHG